MRSQIAERVGEVPLRHRMVPLQTREHAERPADRAHLAQAQADHAHAVGVGGETLVEPGRHARLVELAGHLGEPDQRRRPRRREREVVEALRDADQLGARVVGTAAEREDECERRPPGGKVGHPREDVERRLDECGRVAALPGEDHELRAVDDGGVGMVGRDAELERLVRELLRVLEQALDQRQRRLEPQHEVAQRRLAELLHERGRDHRLLPGLVDPRQLEQVAGAVHVTGEHELGVPDPRTHLDELRGVCEPIVEVAGIEDRGVPAREAERERVVVAEPAGHVDAGRAHRCSRAPGWT